MESIEIIHALANQIDPITGKPLQDLNVLQQPEVMKALKIAEKALQQQNRLGTPIENTGKPWTPEEDRRLSDAYDDGHSIDHLASTHERTIGAIRSRLTKHGKFKPPLA